MTNSVAAVVLAAGAGTRLVPLTRLRPKALCPVGDRPLVDHAVRRLLSADGPVSVDVAVNLHHGRAAIAAHLRGSVHLSFEEQPGLGTAGALGQLAPWIGRRPVLITNADAWLPVDLTSFVADWDGERIRLLCVADARRPDFGRHRYCGVALMPWASIAGLAAVPSGLYRERWLPAWETGTLELVEHPGPFIDCGTPADYLAANLAESGGASVIGEGASIGDGAVLERCVVWPGAVVLPGERLVDAIRADDLTVLVR